MWPTQFLIMSLEIILNNTIKRYFASVERGPQVVRKLVKKVSKDGKITQETKTEELEVEPFEVFFKNLNTKIISEIALLSTRVTV